MFTELVQDVAFAFENHPYASTFVVVSILMSGNFIGRVLTNIRFR